MEANGILGCDIFFAALQQWKQPPTQQHRIPHYCDNQEAVNRSNARDLPHLTDYILHDYDLHKAIQQIRQIRQPTETIWIKGHQDDHHNTNDLPYPTRLNIETDALATLYHQQNPHHIEPPPTIHLYHNNQAITWDYTTCIRFIATEAPLRERILAKHPTWNRQIFNSIAWKALRRTNKRLPKHSQTRIVKLQHKWTATRKQMQDRDNSIDGRCPNCDTRQYETEDHIIRCPHDDISNARELALVDLTIAMSRMETPPDLSHALIYGLEKWIDQERNRRNPIQISWPPANYTYDAIKHRCLADAFDSQCKIGWEEMIRGRLSAKWGDIMQKHYRSTNARKSLTRDAWETTMIGKLWAIFEHTWQARNGLLHGKNDTESKHLLTTKLNQSIKDIYLYDRNTISPHDRRLLQMPLATILHKNTAYKQAWMKSIQIAKEAWAREQGATDPVDRGPITPT